MATDRILDLLRMPVDPDAVADIDDAVADRMAVDDNESVIALVV